MKKRGFTLIELLVVIAIIGILASIVLVSLSGARNKAKDARIQSDMAQIRVVAETLYASSTSYTGLCGEANYTTLKDDIVKQNGGTAPACHDSDDSYCVSAVLNTGGTICVSDEGRMGTTTCTAPDTVCQ